MGGEPYDFTTIESKWQDFWSTYQLDKSNLSTAAEPYYTHVMFPYPSGDKLHVGHVYNYAPADAFARFKRMTGSDVFAPIGFDAFGLPAENHAIKTGRPPAEQIHENIETMTTQLRRLGCMYDWSKTLNTSDPSYYKWTQWIFLRLFERKLAYRKQSLVNFCPKDQTVLANEQVIDGKCERCGTPIIQRPMEQWFLRITAYVERLINDLEGLDWPETSKTNQRKWFGRSSGINFIQRVKGMDLQFEVYDSIPQTYLAQTYTVIAPDHPLLPGLIAGTPGEQDVLAFVDSVRRRRAENPYAVETEVEGVFTGRYVDNPFGTGDFPIWVASYAKSEYGTGWVNCSAHDDRDYRFAKKFGIPLKVSLIPPGTALADPGRLARVLATDEFYREPDGILLDPPEFRGMRWSDARRPVIDYILKKGYGRETTNYRLRDWAISRQRYWGAPIPIVYDPQGNPHAVPDHLLPWRLPEDVDFKPTGTAPLARSRELVERTERHFGKGWKPEVDTMDTFVDSSFYSFRYLAAGNPDVFLPRDIDQRWMPVDMYVGGAEHVTKHLIYARFVTKVLCDAGVVAHDEPYFGLRHQGLIQGEKEYRVFVRADGSHISATDVSTIVEQEVTGDDEESIGTAVGGKVLTGRVRKTDEPVFGRRLDKSEVVRTRGADRLIAAPDVVVDSRSHKMSKSRGNAVSPDPIIAQYGVDAFRIALMFLGPFDASNVFEKDAAMTGPSAFVRKIWTFFSEPANYSASTDDPAVVRLLHRAIKQVTDDLGAFEFNTAVAALMSLVKDAKGAPMTRSSAEDFVRLLAPLAPHLAEELWQVNLGHAGQSVFQGGWPTADPAMLVEASVEMPVQIDGKIRDRIRVPRDAEDAQVEQIARAAEGVRRWIEPNGVNRVAIKRNQIVIFVTHRAG